MVVLFRLEISLNSLERETDLIKDFRAVNLCRPALVRIGLSDLRSGKCVKLIMLNAKNFVISYPYLSETFALTDKIIFHSYNTQSLIERSRHSEIT